MEIMEKYGKSCFLNLHFPFKDLNTWFSKLYFLLSVILVSIISHHSQQQTLQIASELWGNLVR